MTDWLLLIASLPTSAATPRMRLWRTLKHCGAATLRDGVYLLPDSATSLEVFEALRNDVKVTEGGNAFIVHGQFHHDEAVEPLFDRAAHYQALLADIHNVRDKLSQTNVKSGEKEIRKLWKQFHSIQAIDFFPTLDVAAQASGALKALEQAIIRWQSPDEPHDFHAPLTPLSPESFQHRQWATRKRPWVDRLASAWLIHRFIDKNAGFIWLDDISNLPADAVGYDFDGAMFSHHHGLVTFETLATRFRLLEPAIRKLADIVHFLDVGGLEPAGAEGIRQVLAGLRDFIDEDDALFAAASRIFDGLFLMYQKETGVAQNE